MNPSPVQPESGYTRVAHPIMEGLARASFPNALFRVVLVVIRETYGWRRRDAPISYTALERATQLPRKTIARTVSELLREGVVLCIEPATSTTAATYRLQKDARRWGRFSVEVPGLGGVDVEGDTLGGDTLPGDTLEGDWGVDVEGDTPGGVSGATKQVATPLKKGKERKESARAKKRHVLPDSWAPTEDHFRLGTELGVDVHREAVRMRNWALSDTQKNRRTDWNRVFRNWIDSDKTKRTLPAAARLPERVVVND